MNDFLCSQIFLKGGDYMSKPLVAIVGRPNVGKSTFFNKVTGRKISIVKDEPGVTRDRIIADAEWCGKAFCLVDTGGLDFEDKGEIKSNIFEQAKIAVDLSEVILFFVDGKAGLSSSDYDVAKLLRKSGKPIVLVVNKLDNYEVEKSYEFYALKLGDPYPISAEHGKGIGDVLDEVVKNLKTIVDADQKDEVIKIAVVGKPNAGKSSLTNRILNDKRMVVSSIAGTTRDAIDTPFRFDDKDYIIIDTAGMRKRSQIEDDSIENYSVIRALDAVRRADVVLLVVDALQGVTDQDQKIGEFIDSEGKPCVLVINKWDAVQKDSYTMNKFNKDIGLEFAFMSYLRPIYISALTGQRVDSVLESVNKCYENSKRRISMGVLNEIVGDAVQASPPPSVSGQRLKITYCTQIGECPPKFVFFCNNSVLIAKSYARYLENKIRQAFDFEGTPIRLIFRDRSEKDEY